MTFKGNGFVIIIVVASLALLILTTWLVVNLGCSEILQTKHANDIAQASYAAASGAELMYAHLKSHEGQTVTWPHSLTGPVQTRVSGGTAVGSFTAVANTVTSNVFGIVSEGTVNGRKAKVAVRYGFDSPFTNGYPIGCLGPMDLKGTKWGALRSWVRVEGPLSSGSTITTNNVVTVSGELLENQSIAAASFWLGETYDTNNDGQYITDVNGDGSVTVLDVAEGQEAAFAADDITADSIIDDKDAFVYYYTSYLNQPSNNKLNQPLGIAPGEVNYYSGDQTFDPTSVPAGTPIIFVDGNVNILFSDIDWWGADINHTIIATGDITITQPTNGAKDTLTLVSYGDVNTGGVRAFGGVRGDIVVYAHGDFNAYYGGRSDGTIFADGNVLVDTVEAIPGLLNRDINRGTLDWSDPANWPLGLPPSYNKISLSFRIQDEMTEYIPIWQKG